MRLLEPVAMPGVFGMICSHLNCGALSISFLIPYISCFEKANSRGCVMRTALVVTILLIWVVPAQAAVRSEPVQYRLGDALFEGYLAYDDALKGKRPGVLAWIPMLVF